MGKAETSNPVRSAKRIVRRAVSTVGREWSLGVALPQAYKRAAAAPIDPRKVVFVEGKAETMPDAFSTVRSYLEDNYDVDMRFFGLGRTASVGKAEYYRRCIDMAREVATAACVFLADASRPVSCLPIRPETKVVQLWHACGAFKKWGASTAALKFGGTLDELKKHPYYANLDLVTVSSPEVAWAYREAMLLEDTPDVVRPTGVSRTDALFDEIFIENARAGIASSFPAIKGKKVLLYAPTFRGHVADAAAPNEIDLPALRQAIGDEWVLLIKHHPFVKELPPIPFECADFAFNANNFATSRLLAVADALVTDYSSLIFEYSLFERPMVFFAYDKDDYDDWRGFYYDYDELTPGPVVKTSPELVEALSTIDEWYDPTPVRAFRQKFMSACDGHATERICREALPHLDTLAKPPVLQRMAARNAQGPDISIVIPAYNAEDTLPHALDCILAQTYDRARMEVVVVDDCSTDGTLCVAADYARRYPGLITLAQTIRQSGTPAAPRNAGLRLARGEYVFFHDADDWLGEEAVERMLDHADTWGSDVLLVKLEGEGGREVPRSMFLENQSAVDVYRSNVMWTFAPLKLFRRSFVDGWKFPSFMPEDISFVLRAYVLARTVSVAADYRYYHVGAERGEENASVTTWDDVETNLKAYADIFGFIGEHVPEGECRGPLLRRLFGRDVCNTLRTIARDRDEQRARDQLTELALIVLPFYDAELLSALATPERDLLAAAFDDLV